MRTYFLKKTIAAALAALFSISAFGASEIVDLGTLVAGQEYDIPQYKGVKGEYTPSATGPVKFIWTCNPLHIYTSPDHDESTMVGGIHTYTTTGGQMISYAKLDQNTTYYLYAGMSIMSGKLVIQEGDTKIEYVSTSPAFSEDKPYSVSGDYRIDVNFNYPVTIGNSFLLANGSTEYRERIYPVVSNNAVSCDVYATVMDFYHKGWLKEGDTMTLRILQVKDALNEDNKYNGNGRFEIEIPMAGKPAEITETQGFSLKGGNTLNSYYFADDEASKMRLIFDTPIDADVTPRANMVFGNTDNMELSIYQETLDGTVDGNTVTFDFSGKLRRRIDMLPGATAAEMPNDIYVSFNNIFTPDGQRAYTGVLSNPAGFATSMAVNDLQYNIAADFTPARGTALEPGTRMEIWVMNGALIEFDNICMDYLTNGEAKTTVIPMEAITVEDDTESTTGLDKLYYFTVPEYEADPESTVCVYMSNLTCADGLNHADDVKGNFKDSSASIAEIEATKASDKQIFDLSGRRVATPGKGIYIQGGAKIIIR